MKAGLLVVAFQDGGRRLRLIRTKEGSYQVEQLEEDRLGDPRWVDQGSTFSGNERAGQLARLVETLILKYEPQLDAANRSGGWDAVSAILKERLDDEGG